MDKNLIDDALEKLRRGCTASFPAQESDPDIVISSLERENDALRAEVEWLKTESASRGALAGQYQRETDELPQFVATEREHAKKAEDDALFPAYGMTLRDYYIGQALAGLGAHPSIMPNKGESTEECIARLAVDVADAALTAREEGVNDG